MLNKDVEGQKFRSKHWKCITNIEQEPLVQPFVLVDDIVPYWTS